MCLLYPEIRYPLPPDVPVRLLGHTGVLSVFRTIRRLRQVIDEIQPNVVVSNLAYTNIVTGEAVRRCARPPRWIARVGAPPALENRGGLLKFVFARWQKRVYRWVNRFVANSRGIADEMARCFPFTAGRIEVIGNPTDFAWIDCMAAQAPLYQANGKGPVVISVGRLGPEKRPDLLVEAFARVHQRLPAILWICGDGPWRERTARQVAASGLSDSVRLFGFCDNPYALMRQADLFVMTSDYEGLPNALIEAQGLGITAVSTRCPYGPGEIIAHGQTGLLVETGDAEGLARAMEELLIDPQRRQALGQAAQKRTRELFDVGVLVRQWEKVLG